MIWRLSRSSSRGDTIIEVMFAIAVFAFLATGCLALMNRGVGISQRSLEITLVRQQMSDQAETLRYIQQEAMAGNESYKTQWRRLTVDQRQNTASTYGLTGSNSCPTDFSGFRPFILDARALGTNRVVQTPIIDSKDPSATPYPQIVYNTNGSFNRAYNMWIESVPKEDTAGTATKFIDFHIRACWESVGGNTPLTIGTIVRLYED